MSQIKLLFNWHASYSAWVVYTKPIIHLSVSESGEYFTTIYFHVGE